MSSSRLNFFLFCSLFLQILLTTAQQLIPPLYHVCSTQGGNFTSNSTYQNNLQRALTSLSSNTRINYGFYNSSIGQSPDKVTALSLCRGDKKPDACLACINNSTQQIRQSCPNQKEAIIWYDDCMLRYSNRYILGNMEFGPWFWMYNKHNVSDVTQFNQVVKSLLDNLTTEAASGNSLRKFATGNVTVTNNQTIYGLVQCTPDLSKQQCYDCMRNATALLPGCCNGKQGGRVIGSSCHFRYEISVFYDSVPQTSEPPSAAPAPNTGPEPPSVAPAPKNGPEPVAPAPSGTTPAPNSSLPTPPPTSSAVITGMASNIVQTAMLSVISVLLLNKF